MPEPELKVNRRNVAAGVIAAALVVAAIVSLSGGGNDKGSVGVIGDGVSLEDGFTAACVAMWNASGGVAKSMVNTLSAQRPAYASVGPDATFNDRCLLTVAFPDIDSALQFREGGSGGQAWAALGQLSASDLPDSVKGWNVKVVDAGNLALPGSSGGTDTGRTPRPAWILRRKSGRYSRQRANSATWCRIQLQRRYMSTTKTAVSHIW